MSAPGGLTESSLGQTDRVAAIVSRLQSTSVDVPAGDPHAITTEEARKLTDEIKVDAGALWDKISHAYTERAWAALGYESWDAYCTAEFGSLRLRLPREERQDVVRSLREAGLPIRAIASSAGISDQTVQRDLKGRRSESLHLPEEPGEPIDVEVVGDDAARAPASEPSAAPATVTGLDGKTHPKSKPVSRERSPLDSDYDIAITSLRKAVRGVIKDVEALNRKVGDDEKGWFRTWFVRSSKRADTMRDDITTAVTALEELRGSLPVTDGGAE